MTSRGTRIRQYATEIASNPQSHVEVETNMADEHTSIPSFPEELDFSATSVHPGRRKQAKPVVISHI